MAGKAVAPDAIGEPVTDLDEFWLQTARGTVKESIALWRRQPSSSSAP